MPPLPSSSIDVCIDTEQFTVASVHSRDLVVEMTSLKYFVSSLNKPG